MRTELFLPPDFDYLEKDIIQRALYCDDSIEDIQMVDNQLEESDILQTKIERSNSPFKEKQVDLKCRTARVHQRFLIHPTGKVFYKNT